MGMTRTLGPGWGPHADSDELTDGRRLEEWAGHRVVVTGGAGFVGSHLCDRLINLRCEVVCVDNLLTGRHGNLTNLLNAPTFELIEADVASDLPVSGNVDVIFHLASCASPRDYLAHPIETLQTCSAGTHHALRLAEATNARFVLASTSEVYGSPREHPQRESYWGNVNPIGLRAPYDEGKRFAEALTSTYRRTRHVNTGIARIFNTYGPRMQSHDGRAVPTLITQALRGEPLTVSGDGSQTRSLCYADDLVEALLCLARAPEAGPINLGNPHEITILDLAHTILELTGSASPIQPIPAPADEPLTRQPDISLAQTLLGWSPTVELQVGLKRTIDWFVQHLESAGSSV